MEKVWRHEKIPESWKKGLIKLAKKGNLKECKNSRGITLLSVMGKILGRIIVDRVRNGVDSRLRKEQAGYRKSRGTTDQVFILRNIIEQVNEWQATLYLNFIDFEKAFDSIHRESLWEIMKKYGIPEKIVRMIQDKTSRMEEEAKRVGLKINLEKTEGMRINARNQEKITIGGQEVKEVDKFTYLGATVCKEGGGMKDLRNRLSKARGTFVRLKKIWSSSSISRRTKMRLYKTLVVPVMLYGCETWKMNKGDDNAVDIFQNKCLRRILHIRWQDHISTDELLERAEMKPLSEEVKRRRWKMIGHILRQDQNNDSNIAMTWAPEGKRKKRKAKNNMETYSGEGKERSRLEVMG
ncbi:hypothetical protein SKAU_G00414950 [Synaphobranchus kaupii]|uniref:Reverse transcriptase domain-containing protein n=1 Tax=Synaphobranchus kaupii TaxID=118154 RepID=A0A9Q1E7A8_SYNKA|nr:hypothetical protein SKAU_G00414950 [Synaphobranchus kaupii]